MNYAVLLMNLSGRLIDAFLALEETGRFSLAAERCHVSASAFSQMISRLEENVGIKLFDRNTRNVSLTPEGEIFSIGVHRIANEMANIVSEVQFRASKNAGKVAIASPPSLAASWLPKQLAEFRLQFPGIELKLYDVFADSCSEMIANGEVDFGFNAHLKYEIDFDKELFINERLVLICHITDPLANQTALHLEDLRNRSFIYTSKTGSVRQQLEPLIKDINLKDSGFEVSHLNTIAGLVVNRLGISIVSESAIALIKRPELVAIPFHDPRIIRPIYLVKKRNRSLSFAAKALWDQLLQNSDKLLVH
jgi:DNA-binding transcriptional LysR family regulator